MTIDYETLNELLSPKLTELFNYIFQTQGAELRRLDYGAAAEALGLQRRRGWTEIKRRCDQLADRHIIIFEGNKLRISDDVLIARH